VPSNVNVEGPLTAPQLNLAEVVDEVRAVFLAYEAALLANDVQRLNDFFWDSPSTVRYGIAEHNYGAADIRAYREQAVPVSPLRRLQRTIVTTCGRDTACVSSEFSVPASELIGRQTQTWVRFDTGWKIIAAHVSTIQRELIKQL
jgi:hypothetical protein